MNFTSIARNRVVIGGTAAIAGFATAVLFAVTHFAGSSRQSADVTWSLYFHNILNGMDTAEPPDGGMHASNTTACTWNDEDEIEDTGRGDIAGGSSTSDTICIVADYDDTYNDTYPKLLIAKVFARQANLQVSITNDVGDTWTAGASRPFENVQLYELCVQDPVADAANVNGWQELTYWPMIPGTNGYGQIVNYTLHIAAPKTAHNIVAYFEAAFNGFYGTTFRPSIQKGSSGEVPCPPQDHQ